MTRGLRFVAAAHATDPLSLVTNHATAPTRDQEIGSSFHVCPN